eukprot:2435880-Rhodomonas_salina.2
MCARSKRRDEGGACRDMQRGRGEVRRRSCTEMCREERGEKGEQHRGVLKGSREERSCTKVHQRKGGKKRSCAELR